MRQNTDLPIHVQRLNQKRTKLKIYLQIQLTVKSTHLQNKYKLLVIERYIHTPTPFINES